MLACSENGKAEISEYLKDGATHTISLTDGQEALSFNVLGNKVICNNGWETHTISVCSVENGEVLESLEKVK